ncbi:hypothetical protein HMPREF9466_02176 [Fusobacterium necrophorum subsp. funduliforme 1_1_36S]|nr:hypothetical protein HMPREF9466_02176 [Fusobacterium necrophorum subsp. funduliforme 1_1_36S]
MNLFESNYEAVKPLSFQLRPQSLDEIFGQENLLGKHGVLRKLIEKGTLTNSIFSDRRVVENQVWEKLFLIPWIVPLKV